ncbi:MAG TPA: 3-hydroxyacyl-CoA dehydrogenase/enoyl-CoA hydratase family protein [Candidatus Thermoplasmatota archaeon]|nr:3-hydroxyacyl-CoA dehydrogenase/enoyl-CoA hydratase family protein [Candidatus Thermoplasmatota archaeon]
MPRNIATLTVLGAGDMGHGIAELAALRGFEVRLRDISPEVLESAMKKVQWSLEKLVAHATITKENAADALSRLKPTTDLAEAVRGTDLVIEAVPERLDLKQRVFAEVEALAPPTAVLATNTSAMRVSEIAANLKNPSRLVGMHFFNPVLLLSLVEIIPGDATAKENVEAVVDVTRRLGKEPVVLQRDTPGFVTTRLVSTWVGASILAAEKGVATPAQIDSAMKFKAAFPMGPFELADYTGLDVGHHAGAYMASRLGAAYEPPQTLRGHVARGQLGKKTGRGFYTWQDNRVTESLSPDAGRDFDNALVLAVVANEAARLVQEGVASAADVDKAMRLGCAFPKGPLEWADDYGLDRVVKTLQTLQERTGHALATPVKPLTDLVAAGQLGRASGKGFHAYEQGTAGGATAAATGPSYETILVEVNAETKVAKVTLNRAHRLHAINEKMVEELSAAFDALEANEDARVIVLTATGEKAFCVGADLSDGGGMTPLSSASVARKGHLLCLKMEKLGKPIIAAINGYAFGGGLELTLPADFRVAAKRAKVALPEVTLGLLPAMGGTQRLPKLLGLSRAKEFALLGNRVDAEDALRLGLLHRVFENERFEQETMAFAEELATRAPIALRFTKQLLNAAPTTDILSGMELEATAFGVLASTEDVVEGVTSLFMKKKPEFKGR